MKMKINRNSCLCVIMVLFLILQMIILVDFFFCRHFDHAMFESDAASELLLAQTIEEGDQWILSDNWYYSTEVRILYDHLIMVPIYHLCHNYRITFGITNLIIALALFGATVFFLKGMEIPLTYSIVGGILALIPYGSYRRYSPFSMFIGNGYYSLYLIFSLLFLGFYFRLKKEKISESKRSILIFVCCMFAVGMGLSGLRYAMILILPLILYELWNFFFDEENAIYVNSGEKPTSIKKVSGFVLPLVFYVIGYMLSRKWIANSYGEINYSQSIFATIEEFREQLIQAISGLVQMFGFSMDNGKLISVIGFMNLIGLVYFVLIVALIWDSFKQKDSVLRKYSVLSIIQVLVNFGLLLFIKNKDLGATVRYVWVGSFLLFYFPAVWMARRNGAKKRFLVLVMIGCIGVFIANNANLVFTYNKDSAFVSDYGKGTIKGYYRNATPDEREGYISFLKENGLKYGYATFWNANVTTVLTEGDIVIAGVNNDKNYSLFEWLTKKEYIDTNVYLPQFYLLTIEEEALRLKNGWSMHGSEEYRDDKFVIFLRNEDYKFDLPNSGIFTGEFSDEEMGDYQLTFKGEIDSFSEVSIGKDRDSGSVLAIDEKNIYVYSNGELKEQYELTVPIKKEISVSIISNLKRQAVVEITSGKSEQVITEVPWSARIGKINVETDGNTSLKNCELSYYCYGWNKDIWLMGDSYFNCSSSSRWTSYLTQEGYEDFLLNGYPGRCSDEALESLKVMLKYNTPKEIIWCMGMNDGDSDVLANASWQKDIEELCRICEEKNIELVLSTIPNVPSVNNKFKNEYVKNSGLRYIDFAKAVGADEDAEWYPGMLEEKENPVHPTKEGAKTLYNEAIKTCPELER